MRIFRSVGYAVVTVILYLGLPLAGWGLSDLSGFFGAPHRAAYALIVVGFGLVAGWQSISAPEGLRGGDGLAGRLVFRQRLVRIAVTLLLYAALLGLPFADRRGSGSLPVGPAVRWGGPLLFGLGMALVFWSGIALGRLYSQDVTLQEDHRLVTTGPYRWVRHPRYAGGILIGFGLSLTFGSWYGIIGTVLFIGVIMLRIQDEERLMEDAFGPEWEAYRARTPRLIPFMY
jgi:protein-S-isoprenylcysteine O-methyltransferase Ste14